MSKIFKNFKSLKFGEFYDFYIIKSPYRPHFHALRSRKLPILPFLTNSEKQPYIFAFFGKIVENFKEKISKSEKWAYNKKIHTKMTIFTKIVKKQLFSLKIALQLPIFH